MAQRNLWSLIQNKRVTDTVSLKTLQRFVLSLDRDELKHLIGVYLQSVLSPNGHLRGSTIEERTANLSNIDSRSAINEIDAEILSKLSKKYGKKRYKKLLKTSQWKHNQNLHILSMNPEVLAYSFQYLTFRESCNAQIVCSYFLYAKNAYRGLSNYFIDLNRHFWGQMYKGKIDLGNLNGLKHIKISSLSLSNSHTSVILRETLKCIVSNCISCLDILEIDIPRAQLFGDYFMALKYVLTQFDVFSIRKLIWNKDGFQFLNHLPSINSEFASTVSLMNRCSELTHLRFGINDYGYRRQVAGNLRLLTPHLGSHVLAIIDAFRRLQVLDLFCPTWNVFRQQNITSLIATELRSLHSLSIVSYIRKTDDLNMETDKIKHLSLKHLKIEFVVRGSEIDGIKNLMEYVLMKLFSTFIGIEEFEFGFALRTSRWQNPSDFRIDWQCVFGTLLREKRVHAMENGPITVLKCIQFHEIYEEDGKDAISALKLFKNEKYFDLKQFKLNLLVSPELSKFGLFVRDDFVPFMHLFEITKLSFFYGHSPRKYYYATHKKSNWCCQPMGHRYMRPEPGYFDPFIAILSNLPKSVQVLHLKPPFMGKISDLNLKRSESMRLVKKLCNMKTSHVKLKTIILDATDLSSEAMNWLLFMFGYNNKLTMKKPGRLILSLL